MNKRTVRQDHERYESLQFGALDKNIAIAKLPPEEERAAAWANQAIDFVVDKVTALNDALADAVADPNLSEAGKLAKVAPLREAATLSLKGAIVLANKEAMEVYAARELLFGAPELESGDVVGVMTDIEIRQRYASLSPVDRASTMQAQSAESVNRIILALLRDPIVSLEKQQAEDLWRDAVTKQHADDVKGLDARDRAVEWLMQSLRSLGMAIGVTQRVQ